MTDIVQETNIPPDPDGPGGGLDHPEVEDTAGLGGWVWIVLFGSVMTMSILANILMTFCVILNRKKHSVVYFLHVLMFIINLVDYSLLIFEFTLGMGHEYPYSASSCTLYQISVRGNPVLQAAAVTVLLHIAVGMYCNLESRPAGNSNGIASNETTAMTCSRTNNLVVFSSIVVGLLVVVVRIIVSVVSVVVVAIAIAIISVTSSAIISVPTASFATIVTVDEKRYCEIDLASVTSPESQQRATSIFYLLYSAVFSYWLPLMVRRYADLLPLMVRRYAAFLPSIVL